MQVSGVILQPDEFYCRCNYDECLQVPYTKPRFELVSNNALVTLGLRLVGYYCVVWRRNSYTAASDCAVTQPYHIHEPLWASESGLRSIPMHLLLPLLC